MFVVIYSWSCDNRSGVSFCHVYHPCEEGSFHEYYIVYHFFNQPVQVCHERQFICYCLHSFPQCSYKTFRDMLISAWDVQVYSFAIQWLSDFFELTISMYIFTHRIPLHCTFVWLVWWTWQLRLLFAFYQFDCTKCIPLDIVIMKVSRFMYM